MLKKSFLCLVFSSALFLSGCIITGKVVDENGAGVPGVTVTLNCTASGLNNSILNGSYIQCEYGTNPDPWANSFETMFDGKGNYSGGGKALIYSVASDGTLSVGNNYVGVVSLDGTIYAFVENDLSIHVGIKKSSGMTNTILNGTYILCEYGTDPDPWASSFEVTFDGNGNFSGGGRTGTYSVASDGSLTEEESFGIVSPDGSVFTVVDTDASDNDLSIHIGVKKSSGMSNAILNGSYIQCEYGTDPDPWAKSFEVTSDGKGNFSGGSKSGTYSVASDGTLTVANYYVGIVSSDGIIYAVVDDDGSDNDLSIHVGIKKTDCLSIPYPIDNLIAYYPLDGDARDASGNRHSGTEHGGVTYVPGMDGQAASFDGFDDFIDIGQIYTINDQDISISLWINIQDGTHDQQFLTNGSTKDLDPNYFALTHNNDSGKKFRMVTYDGAYNSFYSSYQYNINNWYHLVFIRQGGIGKIYVNGLLENEGEVQPGDIGDEHNWYIGKGHQYDGDNSFEGKIDELRIYNRALSEAEIRALANQNPTEVVITDKEGKYRFGDIFKPETWVPVGNYIVTPSKSGDTFTPPSRNVTIVNQKLGDLGEVTVPVTGVDFVANYTSIFSSNSDIFTNRYVTQFNNLGTAVHYEGFGTKTGDWMRFTPTKRERYRSVNCVVLNVNESQREGSDDIYVAQDKEENIKCLRFVELYPDGSISRDIDYSDSPVMMMPGNPYVGQTWTGVLGTSTVTDTNYNVPLMSTGQGPFPNCLEIKIQREKGFDYQYTSPLGFYVLFSFINRGIPSGFELKQFE